MNKLKTIIYLITRHPRFEEDPSNPVLTLARIDTDLGISFQTDGEIYQTGMIQSIDKLKEILSEATYILILGNLDAKGVFELGMASALGKKVYFLNHLNPEVRVEDFRLDFSDLDLEIISLEELVDLVG